jgi:hypothetical protein
VALTFCVGVLPAKRATCDPRGFSSVLPCTVTARIAQPRCNPLGLKWRPPEDQQGRCPMESWKSEYSTRRRRNAESRIGKAEKAHGLSTDRISLRFKKLKVETELLDSAHVPVRL